MTNGITVSLKSLIDLRYHADAIDISSKKNVSSFSSGDYFSRLRGRGMEFDEVRAYQPGDDIRHMDWRVTARTSKPHTKLYHEERERPVFILVDYNPNMFFGTRVAFKSVLAAQIAAVFGWAAVKNGDRVGGIIFSGEQCIEMRPKARKMGLLPLLKKLADYSDGRLNMKNVGGLSKALKRLRQVVKPGSLILIMSDFVSMDEEAKRHISLLAKHNEMVAAFIYDQLESTLPPPNYYAVSNGNEVVNIDTGNKRFRTKYDQSFTGRYKDLMDYFNKYRINCLTFPTHCSVMDILHGVKLS